MSSTVFETIKPSIGGVSSTGVYVDHVGGVKIYCPAIAVYHRDMGALAKIR